MLAQPLYVMACPENLTFHATGIQDPIHATELTSPSLTAAVQFSDWGLGNLKWPLTSWANVDGRFYHLTACTTTL